jgi:hypothetical protein
VTSIATREPYWGKLSAASVRALAPQAFSAFDAVIGAIGTAADPALLELVRRRVSALLGATGDELPQLADVSDHLLSATEGHCLKFTEQFVIDVAGITDGDRAGLSEALGRATFGFVQALYVLDHGLRLVLVIRQLFGADPLAVASDPAGPSLWPALESMMTAVVCLGALDH